MSGLADLQSLTAVTTQREKTEKSFKDFFTGQIFLVTAIFKPPFL